MLDIGWSEFLVIGVVALVVVGPKELPVMFRTLGRFTAKARSMSREFTRAMEAAAKESGVGDIAKDLKAVTSPRSLGLDAMQNAASRFEKWDPLKKSTPATSKQPAGSAAEMAKAAGAPAMADIGPNTAALAAERAAKRAAVIEAAQDRAAERAEASPAAGAKPAKTPRAKAEKPLIAAVAKAKAAPKAAVRAKPEAATVPAEKVPRVRSKSAALAEVPAAPPAKRARKAPAKTGDA